MSDTPRRKVRPPSGKDRAVLIDILTANALRLERELNEAMALLAECEPCIDEWNFPITLGDRVKASLNEYYGETPNGEDCKEPAAQQTPCTYDEASDTASALTSAGATPAVSQRTGEDYVSGEHLVPAQSVVSAAPAAWDDNPLLPVTEFKRL